MTHICVGKLTIISSNNGLSPSRRQAIIWTNAGILLIGPRGTSFSEILIGTQAFSFKKMHLKMPSAIWRRFCLGLNVLRTQCLLWLQTCQGYRGYFREPHWKPIEITRVTWRLCWWRLRCQFAKLTCRFQMTEFSMGDKFSPFLHDAVLLYAIAINESLNKGLNPKDGLVLANHMKQKVFRGGCDS